MRQFSKQFIPQVLFSDRRGERQTTLADWTRCHCWVIASCHSSVLWLRVLLQCAIVVCYGGGKVTTKFEGVDVVPLQGAIVVCYTGARGGRVTTVFGGGGGAIAGCHSYGWRGEGRSGRGAMLRLGGRVTSDFEGGGVDVVPLLGANLCFISSSLYSGPPLSPRDPRKQQCILSWASCKYYNVLYIDSTKMYNLQKPIILFQHDTLSRDIGIL